MLTNMPDNHNQDDHHLQAAADMALHQAQVAASQDFLERRPDPATDRAAYEQWYYSLTPEQQQVEWQLYYSKQEQPQTTTQQVEAQPQPQQTTTPAQVEPQPQQQTYQPQQQEAYQPQAQPVQNTAYSPAVDPQQVGNNLGQMAAGEYAQANAGAQAQAQQKVEYHQKSKLGKLRHHAKNKVPAKKAKTNKEHRHGPNPLKPLLSAIFVGLLVVFLAYNQVVFAQVKQYIRPESQLKTPIIINPDENPCKGVKDNVMIPKINLNSPVVYDEKSWDNDKIDKALERGVVHYGTTALPGKPGNNVIVGHSSGNLVSNGDFKYEFVLLDALEKGDTFSLCYNEKYFVYKIFRKVVVVPTNIDYIYQKQDGVPDNNKYITTLITCHPPGTNWKRLIVQATQISPQPDQAEQIDQNQGLESVASTGEIVEVPSNSKSFWEIVGEWF